MTLKQQILKEYNNLQLARPSYGKIAKKLGCTKTYVFKVISKAKTEKDPAMFKF